MPFIHPSYKPNLNKYKYSGIDNSFLSRYVLTHYWNWLVSLFPLWMAPNLITLLGFCCILFNLGLQFYYDPNFEGHCPNWVYYSYGIGLWIYASFDAIDGKQARRTGTSGPLGELFDHSCDALNTTFVGLLTISAFKYEHDWWALFQLYIAFTNFYLTTWEEYHTGTLYLSYFSGPVEGLTTICIFLCVTGYVGPTFWTQGFKTALGMSEYTFPLIRNIQINHLCSLTAGFIMALNIINSAYNVIVECYAKKRSIFNALSGLLPFFTATILGYLWLDASGQIFEKCFIQFMLFSGFSVAYNVGLIILSHVTKAPFPFFNIMYLPLLFGAVNANMETLFGSGSAPLLTGASEVGYVYISMILSIVYYLYYSISVINEICDHFDIYCLSIKHLDKVPGYKKDE